MDIEISDALSRTAQEKMADSITDVRSFAQSIGASTSLPDIIRTWDRPLPTDNIFSSAGGQRGSSVRTAATELGGRQSYLTKVSRPEMYPPLRFSRRLIDGSGNPELLTLVVAFC